jgi:flagellar assembly protein FliH
LSDQQKDSGYWGTIFSRGGEHSLGGLDHQRSTAWTAADEAAYLNRVKDKAGQMASGIIADAVAEANRIREAARREGFDAGMADAKAELDTFRAGMAESVAAVLDAIEGQCSHIFDQWREDLVGVCRLAVEKITGIQLALERRAILETLLSDAVSVLEKRREIVIRVNPEDEFMLSDILRMTQERFPDVDSWRVRADSNITAGGMVVESESSLAQGRLESRRAAVEEVLSRLILTDFASASHENGAVPPNTDRNGHES